MLRISGIPGYPCAIRRRLRRWALSKMRALLNWKSARCCTEFGRGQKTTVGMAFTIRLPLVLLGVDGPRLPPLLDN